MQDLSIMKKAIIIAKLEKRRKKLERTIRKIDKQNYKLFDDNLIVRSNHQCLYAKKKELCGELAAIIMTQANVLNVNL